MSAKNTKKSVLITGCSAGGIGDALAKAFHRRGCQVFATARNMGKIQHLKDMGIVVLSLDVLDQVSCKAAAESVKEITGGSLDLLVNNSGLGRLGNSFGTFMLINNQGYSRPLLDVDIDEARKVFDTNVMGIIITVQAFASLIIPVHGTIINIGSVTGIVPLPWSSIYNSSKAAVNHLTDTLRIEMEPLGVNVVLVRVTVCSTWIYY
jgi:1-acylglycerone phosphate reductase